MGGIVCVYSDVAHHGIFTVSLTDCRDPCKMEFPIKVQLPTGDTTVVLADEYSALWEVVKKVETKKELRVENASSFIQLPDGKTIPTVPEQTLINFKDIEKLVVSGTVCTSR